ncbi:MAG: AAA family ATPase, partial [Gemmatimonadota bacterium]
MRFDRLRVGAFGPLRDLDTGSEALPPLVVVQAPNEGGKSSFFIALSSLLYGFYPAGRDRHPYAPWSGEDAELEARITRDDGTSLTVHRRLLSSPWGRVTRNGDGGGQVTDIANRTLSFVAHVRRELFGDVFALTLGDLARIDDESWEEIQDRLLGAMGAEDLRGSRVVIQELEEAADSLWRSDRRGKPEARDLQTRLEELDSDRREARERNRKIRATARNLEELRERLDSTRAERLAVEAVLERARTLGPVRSQLLRTREAEELAGDLEELEDLPTRPDERLRELEEEVTSRRREIASLERRMEELERRAGSVTGADRRLLERATEVRTLGKMAGEVQVARQRLPALDERLTSLEHRCVDTSRQLFSVPWEGVDAERIREVPVGELRSRIRSYRARRDEASELEAAAAAAEREARREEKRGLRRLASAVRKILAGAAGIGILVLVWGLLSTGRLQVLSGGVILGNVVLLWLTLRALESFLFDADRGEKQREAESLRRRSGDARRRADGARDAVAEILDGLPVVRGFLAEPDPEVAHLVGELQTHLESKAEARGERDGLEELLAGAEDRLETAADALDVDLPGGFLAAVATLEAHLDEAADREADARAAKESLEDVRESLQRLREARAGAKERLDQLLQRFTGLGDGDLERGLETAVERMDARDRARTLRGELERQHPDLDELRKRIRRAEEEGEEWTADEATRVRAGERYRELNERIEELISEIREGEGTLRELESRTTLDRIEGEILHVREELERVRRRRDRLALLGGIVRVADHRFRDRNQPDVLRTAGRYLETITGGRYRRLLMQEGELSGTLYLEGPGYPHAVEVDTPISTGTREQVYLALRLAVIDHLDAGGERLPLVLDEAFVNWDAAGWASSTSPSA